MHKIIIFTFLIYCSFSIAQNNSLNFDGNDDYVDLGENFAFEITDSFTIEAWINLNNNNSFQQIIAKLGNGEFSFRGWGFQITNDGRLSGFASTDFFSVNRFVEGTQILELNTWYHVAMVFRGNGQNTVSLYINGESEPLSEIMNLGELTTILTDAPTHIGNFDNGTPMEHFNGSIDEIRIWDVARSSEDIAIDYNTELSGNEENLIGYYKMDETSSSCDIQDCSSNQIHGTREGVSGSNNLPQFSDNIPNITDVECGINLDCEVLTIDSIENIDISISPNPVKDFLLFSGIEFNRPMHVSLSDISGKIIMKSEITTNTLNLSDLPSGLYFLNLTMHQKKITKKLLKM